MKTIKTTAVILYMFLLTNDTFAQLPVDPDFPGPYLCVHQNHQPVIIGIYPRQPKVYIYGGVINADQSCPTYNENDPTNIVVNPLEQNFISWSNEDDEDDEFVNKLIWMEDPHDDDCRFGITFN